LSDLIVLFLLTLPLTTKISTLSLHDALPISETWEYQITCYKKAEPAPDWYKKGIFYQIFPDRFAKGNGGVISPKKNTFLYATEKDRKITRLNSSHVSN